MTAGITAGNVIVRNVDRRKGRSAVVKREKRVRDNVTAAIAMENGVAHLILAVSQNIGVQRLGVRVRFTAQKNAALDDRPRPREHKSSTANWGQTVTDTANRRRCAIHKTSVGCMKCVEIGNHAEGRTNLFGRVDVRECTFSQLDSEFLAEIHLQMNLAADWNGINCGYLSEIMIECRRK
jgi:hypothetical protein